jgi:hypothetical protein
LEVTSIGFYLSIFFIAGSGIYPGIPIKYTKSMRGGFAVGKKTRHQMYKPEKSKVMKMKDEFHDMEDMCDIDDMDEDMDEMEDMCDMPSKMNCMDGMKMSQHMGEMGALFPDCIQLAHAYVPWQTYEKAFTPPEALMKGTLFPELWGVYRIPK